ncbi:ABC transporter permease [Stagnihabitans tardus]|uniref:Autoinducer 2 import system permease protein LsrD n=1 Tax=Stagnihabitans tardus TaxID=2699202 RepID=A0AAE4YEH2_9RHOB|nr:ABC transporter permease [Stagnihabitans tardus]NBZ89843.1 ABC transporter permease [Stagnihabitans tardus]
MSQPTTGSQPTGQAHGLGGLKYDPAKRTRAPEWNVALALVIMVAIFEILNRLNGGSFLFNMRDNVDAIFNQQRIDIMLLQVAIVGIISLGVTQVIIVGGIDLSSGSVVGATAMVTMSFAQTALVNGNPNPKAVFGPEWMDLPVLIPIVVGLAVGLFAGLINGLLVAYTKIPPFIATLGMMVTARGASRWWSNGNPISFPTESYGQLSNGDLLGTLTFGLVHWQGQNPALVFLFLAVLFHLILNHTLYGKWTYAIGSNEAAARMSGINVDRHKVLVYAIAGLLAGVSAVLLTSKNLTAQAGMGVMYELDAIAMAVIGGISLSGGRGSILGTVLGAAIFSVIISGFTSIQLDAYYQEMVKGAIIVGAVILDQARQRKRMRA